MPPGWNNETAAAARSLARKSLLQLGSGVCASVVGAAKVAAAGVQTIKTLATDQGEQQRERVTFARVSELEWRDSQGRTRRLPVALLGYEAGFQVWSLEGEAPTELLSLRRDGAVRCGGWPGGSGSAHSARAAAPPWIAPGPASVQRQSISAHTGAGKRQP